MTKIYKQPVVASSIHPYRVIAKGKPDSIKWYVVKPDGSESVRGYYSVKFAFALARNLHSVWQATCLTYRGA